MYIALLGRQPALSVAELERTFHDVRYFSPSTALFESDTQPSIEHIGGTQKIGHVVLDIPFTDFRTISARIVAHYSKTLAHSTGKITIGISVYDAAVNPRDVQKIGLLLKTKLKKNNVSLRLIPNKDASLSTATSHHNKLGLSENKKEILIIQGKKSTIVAESTGAQNITALAARDQGRPRRDAFVGMLPPKLAQMMINLATGPQSETAQHILDPFCGTGVLLQEALLMGHSAHGTDLSDKMVQYSQENLRWISEKYNLSGSYTVNPGDAMDTSWGDHITAVATEAYLGQPFSAPPSPKKLQEVRGNCNHIIGSFLQNIQKQIPQGTVLCIAVPAWRGVDESITHLPLTSNLENLGYEHLVFKNVSREELLYYRPDQVVARELLVIRKV